MKQIISYLIAITLFSACQGYLDMVPENDVETFETTFEKRQGAEQWLTTAYYYITSAGLASFGGNPAICGADEFVCAGVTKNSGSSFYLESPNIAYGWQMSQDPYCNMWLSRGAYHCIRVCNTFIKYIDGVYNMEKAEKAQWKAEVKALKAFMYFELVKRYGPIVLVPTNIGVEASAEDMQMPRSHVDTCFKAIVDLLDEAIPVLLTNAERDPIRGAFFCKEAACALKAKVLLYAASPLFNGNEFYMNFKNKNGESLFNATYDKEKWKRAAEAADEAVELCRELDRGLIDNIQTENTDLLNTIANIEQSVLAPGFVNKECLFLVKGNGYYLYTLPRFKNSSDADLFESAGNCVGPSMKMVEMFYTENGLPIDCDKQWNFDGRYKLFKENSAAYSGVVPLETELLSLHLRREPRFYADIVCDGLNWRLGNKPNRIVDAHRGGDMGTQEFTVSSTALQNPCGYWLRKMLDSKVPTKTYSSSRAAKGDPTFPVIRVAELYLMQAEAWNEYLENPDEEHVYAPLNKVRARAGIPDVKTSWMTYSTDPARVTTKAGMREIIRREINIEFAFEGHRFWNLRRWKTAHEELNSVQKGWNILGETNMQFYNNYDGPVIVGTQTKFMSPRDYLFPIKSEEVMVSGCVQNPGW